jgi:hypothetical protein
MKLFLDLAWTLVAVLKYGGLAIALAGVAVFGWHFVRENAHSARDGSSEILPSSWRGPGPMLGAKMLVIGIILQILSVLLAVTLPGR